MKVPENKLDIKIIALDLDDTLLCSKLFITEKTVEALQNACKKGIYIVLSSGRTEYGIFPHVHNLNIAGSEYGRYIIAINGSAVFDLHTRQCVYSRCVDSEVMHLAYEMAKERGLPAQVYGSDVIWASYDNEWSRKDCILCGSRLEIVDDFASFINKPFPKLLIPAEEKKIAEFTPVLKKALEGKAEVFISKPYFLEVMPYDCGKGQALRWLCNHIGIERDRVMAFGDSMNDESMLTFARHGVAMCNGLGYIKEIASYVTLKDNENDGIADFLNKYVL